MHYDKGEYTYTVFPNHAVPKGTLIVPLSTFGQVNHEERLEPFLNTAADLDPRATVVITDDIQKYRQCPVTCGNQCTGLCVTKSKAINGSFMERNSVVLRKTTLNVVHWSDWVLKHQDNFETGLDIVKKLYNDDKIFKQAVHLTILKKTRDNSTFRLYIEYILQECAFCLTLTGCYHIYPGDIDRSFIVLTKNTKTAWLMPKFLVARFNRIPKPRRSHSLSRPQQISSDPILKIVCTFITNLLMSGEVSKKNKIYIAEILASLSNSSVMDHKEEVSPIQAIGAFVKLIITHPGIGETLQPAVDQAYCVTKDEKLLEEAFINNQP